MVFMDPQTGAQMLQAMLQPWHQALQNPARRSGRSAAQDSGGFC